MLEQTLPVLLSPQDIDTVVQNVALQVNNYYKRGSTPPIFIGVLNGAFIFMADLVRKLTFSPEIDFIQVSSYGSDTKSRGSVVLVKDIDRNINGRSILLIDDIVDSGLTTTWLKERLLSGGAKSVKVCTLLVRKKSQSKVDFTGHVLESDKFVLGYGLDFEDSYRNFPYIMEVGAK